MRITSLMCSITASLLLLGFAGQADAVPGCADQNPPLPEFVQNKNVNAAWNGYVSQQLSIHPTLGWSQLKQGFQTQQCWTPSKAYFGITQPRSCNFDAPTPVVVNGTEVHYQATSNPANNAILHLRGCDKRPVAMPAELFKK